METTSIKFPLKDEFIDNKIEVIVGQNSAT